MSTLFSVGMCCFLISIWGTIQLLIMGICYKLEAVTLIEDCEAEDYEDYDDFIKKTQHNYAAVANNCFIAAVVYLVLIFVSYGCIVKARADMKAGALLMEDDDLFCTPKTAPPRDDKKIT